MTERRILLVTRTLDDRHIGGSAVRLRTLRSGLSLAGTVTVALLDQWPADRPLMDLGLQEIPERVVVLRRGRLPLPERFTTLGAFLAARSSSMDNALQGRWTPPPDEPLENFDLVWYFRSISFLRYRMPPGGPPVVVDFDDLEEDGRARRVAIARTADRAASRGLRARIARQCTMVSVASDADRRRIPSANVEVIPNSVVLCAEQDLGSLPAAPNLLFVGHLGYAPNRAGIAWFVSEVLPLVRIAVPRVQLRVVGPRPSLLPEHVRASVEAIGAVADLDEHYAWARAAIAPILTGSGTRLKILEAMSQGRPVASTSVGAEGLEVEAGRDILVGDDPAGLARACIELLTDDGRARAVADRGRRLVALRYDSLAVERAVADIAERAMSAGPARLSPRPTRR